MTRLIRWKALGVAQTKLLRAGLETPVTFETLPNGGQKRALHSLKRLELIAEDGRTTASGAAALARGEYPFEADYLARVFEERVQLLMTAWGVKRLVAIRRAVAIVATQIEKKAD